MKSAFSAGLFVALAAFGIAQGVGEASAQETRREIVTTENGDYYGFDLRAEKDVSLDQCKQMCLDDDKCRAFTFNTKVSWCFLKSDFSELGIFDGAVAGKVVEISTEPDLGAPPELAFVPSGTLEQGKAFGQKVRTTRSDDTLTSVDELVEAGRQDFADNDSGTAAINFTRALALDPDNVETWLAFSREASGWLAGDGHYDYRLQEMAVSSALGAYDLSRTASARAEALAVLAAALEQRRLYRPALEAYKASLELKDSQQVATAYRELREAKGFRITGNRVRSDQATPGICVDFSEELVKSGVDYSSYVTVDGRSSGAIEASGKQICVEGLEHGNTYRISLRSGLPSSVGEVLEKPVAINAYVRDRAPAVRFSGANFVLPDTARRGIPITGINADSADLELYRIGDRALADLLAGSEYSGSKFLTQLEGYSVSDIAGSMGEPVWKGSIELKRERNREVVTSFPIDEAVPERKPGIYVLTANVTNQRADNWEPVATQWFLVSDIGLSTYAGTDGLTVFTRSLETAKPVAGVEVTLIARNNEVLGTASSDANGKAVFTPGLMRGSAGLAPTVLTAKAGEGEKTDFAFLDMTRAGFDLSDRGVGGRTSPGPLDVYTYLDRGIYRPGESVHSVSLARDEIAGASPDLPLTMIFTRPDGVEATRIVSGTPSLSGHEVSIDLPENAMRGVWQLRVYTDPKEKPISEKSFLVEDFTPDRIEFDLASEASAISPERPADISVKGRFLYGAPAAALAIEGEMRLKSVRERAEAPGYQFGLADEDEDGDTVIPLGGLERTDENGETSFTAGITQLPTTTRPLQANIVVRMREDGGRAVERDLSLPVVPDAAMIGIKADFEDGQVRENSTAGFHVIALDGEGKRTDLAGLDWSLSRIDRHYQWYRDGSSWRYEAVEIPQEITGGKIDARAGEAVPIEAMVEWGRYRLDVESRDAQGPATSVEFHAGWYVEASSTETPDALEIALDKDSYDVGETAKLKVSPRFAGELQIVVGAEKLYETFNVAVPAEGSEIDIPVGDWGAGAYVTATLYRPGSAQASHMPARALGTTWLTVDPGDKELSVSLGTPEQIRPDTVLSVPVHVENAGGGEAYVTVAAVDVGILNLTRFTPPDPADWFFGQRALGLEIRDLYGKLIDGSLGEFGRIRSGGDGPGMTAQGSPPTEKLLALFSGIVALDANGNATIDFEVPQFNGTARVMAVAWSKSAVGSASKDVIIRDPVVLSASLPKVLAPGDKARTLIEIHNTDGASGTYSISLAAANSGDDLVSVGGLPAQVELAKGERKLVNLNVEAAHVGTGEVTFSVTRDGDEVASVTRVVHVRPATLPVSNRMTFPLAANGGSVTLDGGLLEDSIAENAKIDVSVTRYKAFDVAGVLTRLIRYPYGCAEQTTSRALPLLYLSDLDAPAGLTDTSDLEKRVGDAVTRLATFQTASGSFGLWGPEGGGDLWLDAYVTDFLTRAREKGFAVPEQTMRLAVQNLQNSLADNDDIKSDGDAIAHALYVLARNRMASVGDLRYYADTRLAEFGTPLARAHLGAALSLYNEHERAGRAFSSALELARRPDAGALARSDYGSVLRDGAAMLALASETRPVTPLVPDMMNLVSDALSSRRYTSTQEDAWLLLAARATQEANRSIALKVNGETRSGAYSASRDGGTLGADPLSIVNETGDAVTAVVTTLASPRQPLPAGGDGFTIERRYYTLDGEETPLNEVHQNERFVVVLNVSSFNNWPARILVSDLLPGGFEIDNPRLVRSAELAGFDWLGDTEIAHSEFRNDRFVAALNRGSGDNREFSVAYVVRAVTPGTYVHPAASVEDMYRPELSARTATGFLEVQAVQ
ncbi:MAG: alpha-2-macroglobulin family protein [Nitratireductor sp.]|nr:alpha-2-macroglobulin family protein [Nitratireductor sp.]